MTASVDTLLFGGVVVTMDPERRVFGDGAIAIADGEIVDIGQTTELRARWQARDEVDLGGRAALPGLVNAHVHLTGLDLLPGLEPADAPVAHHLRDWALPSHVQSSPEDELVSARYLGLQMLRQGVTAFIEAATIRFPEAVLEGLAPLGIRGAIGTWTWDGWPEPAAFATTTQQAIARMRAALDLPVQRVMMWPTVIGHDSCSDELLVAAARAARERDSHWSLHMSPGTRDGEVYRARTGLDPMVHLQRLGVLDERTVVAHAIHVSDAEIEALNASGATVAFCPVSSLHLASGLSRAGRHPEMAHVALGTDSPHLTPMLQAAGLACFLYGDMHGERAYLRAERALEWLTLEGARALGWQDRIGSLEVGKRADIAIFDINRPIYNVAANLAHHTPGRATHVFIDGEHVLRNGHHPREPEILAAAAATGSALAARAGMPATSGWPIL